MSSKTSASAPSSRVSWQPLIRVGIGFGIVVALSIGLFVYWRISIHNEGVVEPGVLYRSCQLNAADLQDEITKNGIRTVINLRGPNTKLEWYRSEMAVCAKNGVQHVDISMNAIHLPRPEEAVKLLDALQHAPRPILIHCRSGSDRTGLAACLFLIDQEHMPWKTARLALSIEYGHVAIYPYFEMDEFIQLYGQSDNPSIDDWTRNVYPKVYADEMRESKWDEMTEPLELLVRGRLD